MLNLILTVSNETYYLSIVFLTFFFIFILWMDRKKQKHDQKALHQNLSLERERVHHILLGTHAGLFEWDYQTKKIVLSDSFSEFFDTKTLKLNQLTIDDLINLVHEADRASFISTFELLLGGHQPYIDFDCRIYSFDHKIRQIHVFSKIIKKDSVGKPLIVVGIVNYLTAEQKATKEVAQLTYLLKNVIENNNGGVAVFDKKMNYLYVSELYKKQFNLNEDPVGKNHYELFPDLPDKFKEAHQRSLKGEILGQSKDTYLRSSGEQMYSSWSTRPWYDTKGDIGGIISYVQIITDQVIKEMQLEYASKHDTLTGLFNRKYLVERAAELDTQQGSSIGIMMVDLNGLKLINDAYGYQDGDTVIKMVADKLKTCAASCGELFRIGGDEFAFIAKDATDEDMRAYIRTVHEKVSEITYKNIKLSVSAGYAIKSSDKDLLSDVLREAESNLLRNKLLDSTSLRNSAIKGILQTLTDKHEVEKTHSMRVQSLCMKMGEVLDFDKEDMDELSYAAVLHDIGKIAIPDAILGKPAKLTEEEFEIMKTHTTKGYEILKSADQYTDLAKYALTHHEKFDGTGYPNGTKGEDIPLISRIIAIADAYEAMTADRPYRKAQPLSFALDQLNKYKGKQFDPKLVDLFVDKVIPFDQENITSNRHI